MEPPASRRAGPSVPLTIRTGLRPVRRERGLPTGRKHEASRLGRTARRGAPRALRTGRRPVSRSRHAGKQPLCLLPSDSLSDTVFPGAAVPTSSDTVAQVAGITGRSSPAPEWWGRRPRRSFGTGEERPSSRRQQKASPTSKPQCRRKPARRQTSSDGTLNERGRQTERSREGSVTSRLN